MKYFVHIHVHVDFMIPFPFPFCPSPPLPSPPSLSCSLAGDNVLTAVSVARICQIINPWSNVVLVKAESGSDQIPLVSYELLEEAGKSGSSEEFASVVVPFDGDFSDTDKQVKPEIRKKDVQLVIEGATFKVIRAHHPDLLPKVSSS